MASGVGVWRPVGLFVVMLAIVATVILRKARKRSAPELCPHDRPRHGTVTAES
jgi:hypothetical protein